MSPRVTRSVTIDESLYQWIESEAKRNGIKVSAQISLMLNRAREIEDEKERLYNEKYNRSDKAKEA